MSWVINKKRQTKRIESPDGGSFIEIQKMNQGDRDDLLDLLATMRVGDKSKEQLANMNLGKMRHFQRVRSITSWNLKDDAGKDMAVSEANIRDLPDEVVEELDKAIEELNPEKLTEDKKKK